MFNRYSTIDIQCLYLQLISNLHSRRHVNWMLCFNLNTWNYIGKLNTLATTHYCRNSLSSGKSRYISSPSALNKPYDTKRQRKISKWWMLISCDWIRTTSQYTQSERQKKIQFICLLEIWLLKMPLYDTRLSCYFPYLTKRSHWLWMRKSCSCMLLCVLLCTSVHWKQWQTKEKTTLFWQFAYDNSFIV